MQVAIKIVDKRLLSPVDAGRLSREISALRKLRHQHICHLYEVHESDGRIYLLMEVRIYHYYICISINRVNAQNHGEYDGRSRMRMSRAQYH